MIINTTGMKWLKQLFHINEHRINNTGWMMKWWWNGGVERKAKLLCLQFKQSCPWATLSYFCLQNKAGKSTQWGESSQKMYQKSSALSIRLECEEVSLQIEFTALPPKDHNFFVKIGTKRELEKKELRSQANNAQYNTQGERRGGSGVKWEDSRGGGRAAPLHKLIYELGEIVWQCT